MEIELRNLDNGFLLKYWDGKKYHHEFEPTFKEFVERISYLIARDEEEKEEK